MLKLCGFHISNYFNKARLAIAISGSRSVTRTTA